MKNISYPKEEAATAGSQLIADSYPRTVGPLSGAACITDCLMPVADDELGGENGLDI